MLSRCSRFRHYRLLLGGLGTGSSIVAYKQYKHYKITVKDDKELLNNIKPLVVEPMSWSDIGRSVQLLFIFAPWFILYPLFALNIISTKMYYGILNSTLIYAGSSFIKIGQWMSCRPDIFSREICETLQSLQNELPSESPAVVKGTIESAFNLSMEEIFESFDWRPLGTGCIGQVFLGTLHSGEKVAVKVQRQNCREQICQDMKILLFLSQYMSSKLLTKDTLHRLSIEFQTQTDFRKEAEHLKIFNENFKNSECIIFPEPIEPYVSRTVLIESFLEGKTLGECQKHQINFNKDEVATNLMRSFLFMILRDNFIHGDLHPGNILIMDDKIGLIDTGLVIKLSPSDSRYAIDLIKTYMGVDAKSSSLGRLILESQPENNMIAPEVFVQKVDETIDQYQENPEKYKIEDTVQFSMSLLEHHHVYLPPSFVALLLSFTLVHGVGTALDRTINMIDITTYIVKNNI